MQLIDLTGIWQARDHTSEHQLEAQVPGTIHQDLIRAEIIEDPFYRDNEDRLKWIHEKKWIFTKEFICGETLLQEDHVELVCEGLDTLATLKINGKRVAQTKNMHRTYRFPVKKFLKLGANTIEVQFDSVPPYIAKMEKVRKMHHWGGNVGRTVCGWSWLRKEACNFGWDWGPKLLTCGIWRDIKIEGRSKARIDAVHCSQLHGKKSVECHVRITLDSRDVTRSGMKAHVQLLEGDNIVANEIRDVHRGMAYPHLLVKNPKLWWSNGLGEQNFYQLRVIIMDANGVAHDHWERRIGLRHIELIQEEDRFGRSFCFSVNGVKVFSKGANWIPDHVFAPAVTKESYDARLEATAEANMNMLRVWGGGIFEDDYFYDRCDELGILVWQDFLFACATYPLDDEEFLKEVDAESIDNIKRIRHHPSLALWCGNNELRQGLVADEPSDLKNGWEEYTALFHDKLAHLVQKFDPDTPYWPASPHSDETRGNPNDEPDSGDAHLWDVWHGKKPFEWYRGCTHRFNSEFGFQSFPEPKTVRGYTLPEDRFINSKVMEWHQRSGIGNTTIMHYMCDWFRLPGNFNDTLWLSQILQGMAITYAVEHWRRSMPRGMGTLYWQLNDCWPVASWSSIDSKGRWKALHYMAKRFFSPLLLSAVTDPNDPNIAIHITSDELRARKAVLNVKVLSLDGTCLYETEKKVSTPKNASKKVLSLNVEKLCPGIELSKVIAHAVLIDEKGNEFAETQGLFVRPKHVALADTAPKLTAKKENGGWSVTLSAKSLMLWTWLNSDSHEIQCDNNFAHLLPGVPRRFHVTFKDGKTPKSVKELKETLQVRHLGNMYAPEQ